MRIEPDEISCVTIPLKREFMRMYSDVLHYESHTIPV